MLKKIVYRGFKSFADKVEIEFSQGITAVIGPNGCGKSNIFDGVRTVLGEQSAKSLRGGKIDDLIFNGSDTRKPHNFAEVSLTFDNSMGYLKNCKDDNVTVTRRIIRGGGSEYLINHQPARLKDVHDLFLDSGVGSNSYSIIGQGQIERILSTKLEDRRAIFEEAAGIVKLKHQKEQTENRLKDVDGNLARVEDIVGEIKRQLDPLRKQAEKAAEFNELSEHLKTVEVQYLLHEFDSIDEKISRFKADASDLEEKALSAAELLESAERRSEASKESYQIKNDELFGEQELLSQLSSEMENLNGRANLNKERIENAKKRIAELEENIREIEDNYSISAEDFKNKQARMAGISSLLKDGEAELRALADKLSLLESEKIQIATDTDFSRNKSVEDYNVFNQEKYELEQLNKRERELERLLAESEAKQDELFAAKSELESSLFRAEKDHDAAFAELQSLQSDLSSKKEQLKEIKDRHDQNLQAMRDGEGELIRKRNKLEAAEAFIENNEGFYEGVKAVLKARKEGRFQEIRGAVADLIHVEKTHETALESLLGQGNMNSLIANNSAVVEECISFLKEGKRGRATFLPLDIASPVAFDERERKSVESFEGISFAIDFVSCDADFAPVMRSLLGRTLVADNLNAALRFLKGAKIRARIATLDGEVLQAGSVSGGASHREKPNYFAKKREAEELRESCSLLEKEFESRKGEHARLQSEHASLEAASAGLADRIDALREKFQDKKALLDDARRKVSHSEEEFQAAEVSQKETKLSLQEIRKSMVKLTFSSDEKEKSHKNQIALLAELDKKRLVNESAFSELGEKKTSLLVSINSLRQEEGQLKEYFESLNGENESLEDKIARLQEKKKAEASRISELAALQASLEEEAAKTAEKTEEKARLVQEKKAETQALVSENEALERDIKALRGEKETFEKELHQKQVSLGKRETEKSAAAARLQETYEIGEEEIALIVRLEIDYAASKKDIDACKRKIASLGAINHAAIEECDKLEERYGNEKKQLDDVKEAKGDLLKLLKTVEEEMTLRFNETFDSVAGHFSKIFSDLFEGGKAKLSLAAPEDPLNSAIEIEAQPPGKKPQSINQLSGGEKAFTAVALIFAIISAKPSPFIILDEVDAPLDDANVSRFAFYLKKFSDKAQFIIVTHRKGTMMVSDFVYGVTQEERGVSIVFPHVLDDKAAGG